jgi:3',5'-cyclic AMP phosphodiesterase CpdA
MKTTFRALFSPLLLLLLLLTALPAFAADVASFAIIGDTRIGLTESVYTTFLQKMDKEGVKLIFNTGDVINRAGRADEWKRYLELTGNRTVHIAPGNHDISNEASVKTYSALIGKPLYYSFSIGDTQFIMLCSSVPKEAHRIVGAQLDWLKEELKKPFAFRFVFVHEPPFPTTYGAGYGLDIYTPQRDALHRILVANHVTIVFSGHEHLYNRSEKDGIIHVITGGGGARLLTSHEEYGGFHHYILAKKQNEGYVFTVFDMNEYSKDRFSIKR